jgi:hypothetical protein
MMSIPDEVLEHKIKDSNFGEESNPINSKEAFLKSDFLHAKILEAPRFQ